MRTKFTYDLPTKISINTMVFSPVVIALLSLHPGFIEIGKSLGKVFWAVCVAAYLVSAPLLHIRRHYRTSETFEAIWEKRMFGFVPMHIATVGLIISAYFLYFHQMVIGDRMNLVVYEMLTGLTCGGLSIFWFAAAQQHAK